MGVVGPLNGLTNKDVRLLAMTSEAPILLTEADLTYQPWLLSIIGRYPIIRMEEMG